MYDAAPAAPLLSRPQKGIRTGYNQAAASLFPVPERVVFDAYRANQRKRFVEQGNSHEKLKAELARRKRAREDPCSVM